MQTTIAYLKCRLKKQEAAEKALRAEVEKKYNISGSEGSHPFSGELTELSTRNHCNYSPVPAAEEPTANVAPVCLQIPMETSQDGSEPVSVKMEPNQCTSSCGSEVKEEVDSNSSEDTLIWYDPLGRSTRTRSTMDSQAEDGPFRFVSDRGLPNRQWREERLNDEEYFACSGSDGQALETPQSDVVGQIPSASSSDCRSQNRSVLLTPKEEPSWEDPATETAVEEAQSVPSELQVKEEPRESENSLRLVGACSATIPHVGESLNSTEQRELPRPPAKRRSSSPNAGDVLDQSSDDVFGTAGARKRQRL